MVPSTFRFGDQVSLLQHNKKSIKPCAKLDYQWLGPFVTNGKINDVTFHLDLPPQLQSHPIFHISIL